MGLHQRNKEEDVFFLLRVGVLPITSGSEEAKLMASLLVPKAYVAVNCGDIETHMHSFRVCWGKSLNLKFIFTEL